MSTSLPSISTLGSKLASEEADKKKKRTAAHYLPYAGGLAQVGGGAYQGYSAAQGIEDALEGKEKAAALLGSYLGQLAVK